MVPSGANVVPVTSKLEEVAPLPFLERRTTFWTDIMLVVSVPVLSEQITVVQPKDSTEGKERTMAFFFAIFTVPSARQVVRTAGSPSGIAATASATAILK